MPLNEKEKKALELIKEDIVYSDYFFQRVKDLKWFYPLKEKLFFEPQKSISFDNTGNALFWNVLLYLEQISLQLKDISSQDATKYAKELIKIIDEIVNYSFQLKQEKSYKKLNNYHNWWFCVKILNNIPTELIISQNLLTPEQFKKWLLEWISPEVSGDLTISDIAEKLLPKFLDNKDTIKFAEIIIEVITAIKKRDKQHPFTKREDAVLVYSSYWLLEAFKKYSSKIGEVCSKDIIYDLADKLKRALEYKQKDYYVILKVNSNVYQIQVSRIEKDGLGDGEIGFKEDIYNLTINQFSNGQLEDIDLKQERWQLLLPDNPAISIMTKHSITAVNKQTFNERVKENLPSNINWQSSAELDETINHLYDGLYEDYSQVWCRSLKDSPEHHSVDADDILTMILRDALIAKCKVNKKEGEKILKDFLSNKYNFPIFKRLVILIVDKLWQGYNWLLSDVLSIPDILTQPNYEVEIYDLLKNHQQEFNPQAISKLKDLIEKIPKYYQEKNLEDYWRYKWYSPLKDNEEFKELYNEAKEKVKPKGDKPYEPEYKTFKGGFVTHKSLLSKEKILEMPIPELIRFLNEFKGADLWKSMFEGEPDKEGLAETLQVAVRENPEKFIKEIDLFHSAPYFYVHHLFGGLKDAFISGKDFTSFWSNIFDFCLNYVKDPNFLEKASKDQGGDSGKGKYIWVIEDIVDLIEVGSKDESRGFGKEYFDIVKQIFEVVIPLPEVESEPDTQRDALTYALNTTFGRIIMSFIAFSLRVRRVTQREEENWGKNHYEQFFERKGIEAWIWFGRFLPNIRYLDKDYADNKIREFSEYDASDFRWRCFMEGYLSGSYVYDDIYELMRHHYVKAIKNKVLPEQIDYRLVQHITLEYLRGKEKLEEKNSDGKDSLFWKMLADASTPEKHDRWLEVARFFWSISGRTIKKEDKEREEQASEETKTKILEFWKWTFDKQDYVKQKLGEKNYNRFLSKLCLLTIYLDNIDENSTKEWLLLSAPYVHIEHNSGFFIEYLTKFVNHNDSLKHIGKIFLKILENSTPTFKDEDIRLIVKSLYELWKKDEKKYKEVKDDADEICNTYGRRGIHFLKDVWSEYNK